MNALVDRIPPNSLEAEMMVLGAIMVDGSLFDVAAAIVRATDFYAPLHETVWASIAKLAANESPIDKISVAGELRLRGMLDKVGGMAYLSSCMDVVSSASTVAYYANLIREKAELRALIRAAAAIAEEGYSGEDDVRAAQARSEAALAGAMEREQSTVVVERVGADLDRILMRIEDGVETPVFRSPWSLVNQHCGGFMPGELVGWVAAPKVGKSGVVLGIADFSAMKYGATALFCPENGKERTANRILAMYSDVAARKIREGVFSPEDGLLSRLIVAKRKLASRPLFLFGREVKSLAAMWRTLRRMAANGPIASIVLDHVGVLEDVVEERGRASEHQRLDRAYQTLIDMAHRFACPVHVVQHLNRQGYMPGKDGKPVEPNISTIAHLRGGGNLEGHADHIIFPYRAKPLGTFDERQTGRFIIALSRDGEGGYVDMRYIGRRHLWLETDGENIAVPWFERKATFHQSEQSMFAV